MTRATFAARFRFLVRSSIISTISSVSTLISTSFVFATAAIALSASFAPTLVFAQPGPAPVGPIAGATAIPPDEMRPLPSDRYYLGARLLETGDFKRAALFYRTELKEAAHIGTSQWVDSICYYAALGESFYQAGDLQAALESYNEALTLSFTLSSWLSKTRYSKPATDSPKSDAPWGATRRPVAQMFFPRRGTITVGDTTTPAQQKLGVSNQPVSWSIDGIEVLRCLALSIRRRTEILGDLAPFDPMSDDVLDAYSNRAVSPNHWSVPYLDVLFGLALSESGKSENAARVLANAILLGGSRDHQLSGVALLELGNLFLRANKLREAAECYYESSICAFNCGDNLLVEEAIRNYSNAAKALRRGPDPIVERAFGWAKSQKAATLIASFGLEFVENLIYEGKTKLATSGLASIQSTMSGTGLTSSRAADRWNYLNALLFYINGQIADGDASLALVVEGMKVRSPWAAQLLKLDRYVANGELTSNGPLTPRNAADLYDKLLREPTVVDWAFRPTESLAIQMIAPPGAYERWFQLLFDRDLKDKAFEVGERIKRERFYSTQTYGGRLASLRYILTADDALTTNSIKATRQRILLEFPTFAETVKESKAILEALNAIPTSASDDDSKKRRLELFTRLADVSAEQEARLHFIAAGRMRVPYVFPPVYSVKEVQQRLPEDTAVLSFVAAGGDMFGFMIGKDCLDSWRVGPVARVGDAVSAFLKSLGVSEGNKQVDVAALAENRWKTLGAKMREIVLGAGDVDADRFNMVFSKLVVVPDSVLWYLPFEALCLPAIAAAPANGEDAQNGEEEKDGETGEDGEDGKTSETAQADDSNDSTNDSDDASDEIGEESTAAKSAKSSESTDLADSSDSTDSAQTTQTAQTARPNATGKRPSRAAREKARLDAIEKSLIPMIQVPELTIRYAATVGLALPNALGRNSFVETTVALGITFPRQTSKVAEAAFERFAKEVSKAEPLKTGEYAPIPGSLLAARLKRLIVWNEIIADVWNWAPFVPEKHTDGNRVSDWIYAPWGAPRLLVLPALRTRAESALKKGGDGSELFLAILAAQASGADAMLLSRWRTGGRSAFDLSTDFVKNYESEPVADAWKDAVAASREREIVVDEEPRLMKLKRDAAIPKYDLPFWWAGYLTIDSGESASAEELEKLDADAAAKMAAENATLDEPNAAVPVDAPKTPGAAAPTGQNGRATQTSENASTSEDGEGGEGGEDAKTESPEKTGESSDESAAPLSGDSIFDSGSGLGDLDLGLEDATEEDEKSDDEEESGDSDEKTSDEPGGVVPKIDVKTPKVAPKSGGEPSTAPKNAGKAGRTDGAGAALDLGPRPIRDEDLQKSDEAGDDYRDDDFDLDFDVDDETNGEGSESANAESDAESDDDEGEKDESNDKGDEPGSNAADSDDEEAENDEGSAAGDAKSKGEPKKTAKAVVRPKGTRADADGEPKPRVRLKSK